MNNIYKSKQVLSLIAIAIIINCLYGCSDAKNWNKLKIEKTKEMAIPIIKALRKYKQDKGKLPEDLNELAPKYIPNIQKPPLGDEFWTYFPYSNGEYVLTVMSRYDGFDTQTTYKLKYRSSNNKWDIER